MSSSLDRACCCGSLCSSSVALHFLEIQKCCTGLGINRALIVEALRAAGASKTACRGHSGERQVKAEELSHHWSDREEGEDVGSCYPAFNGCRSRCLMKWLSASCAGQALAAIHEAENVWLFLFGSEASINPNEFLPFKKITSGNIAHLAYIPGAGVGGAKGYFSCR